MPVKFTFKVSRAGNSIRITIPKVILDHLSLKEGDYVSMWVDNSHIIIEKKEEI